MKSMTSATLMSDITIQDNIVNQCAQFLDSQRFDMVELESFEFDFYTPQIDHVYFIVVNIEREVKINRYEEQELVYSLIQVKVLLSDEIIFDVPSRDDDTLILTEEQEQILCDKVEEGMYV